MASDIPRSNDAEVEIVLKFKNFHKTEGSHQVDPGRRKTYMSRGTSASSYNTPAFLELQLQGSYENVPLEVKVDISDEYKRAVLEKGFTKAVIRADHLEQISVKAANLTFRVKMTVSYKKQSASVDGSDLNALLQLIPPPSGKKDVKLAEFSCDKNLQKNDVTGLAEMLDRLGLVDEEKLKQEAAQKLEEEKNKELFSRYRPSTEAEQRAMEEKYGPNCEPKVFISSSATAKCYHHTQGCGKAQYLVGIHQVHGLKACGTCHPERFYPQYW